MRSVRFSLLLVAVFSVASAVGASDGDADPLYRSCVQQCEETGCVGDKCLRHCKFSSDGKPIDGSWYMREPLYQKWKKWDCLSDCQYHCMLSMEEERMKRGDDPVKYHRKWPFQMIYGIQEPISVSLSAIHLAIQFHGWVSFLVLVYYKLPLQPNEGTYYEYTTLMHVYGVLAMNALIWSCVFHSRDVELTEKLSYSSGATFLGFALILAVVRAFSIKDEAARVMVAALPVAFFATHALYLNFYDLDADLNNKVCLATAVAQLLVWAIWAGVNSHPSRWKLRAVVLGGLAAMLLELSDFPPYRGILDAHAVCLAVSIPFSYVWWSFVRDDAEFRTLALLNKVK